MIEKWIAEALCIIAIAFVLCVVVIHILKLIGED
jgi:uncharacterized protein YoxC